VGCEEGRGLLDLVSAWAERRRHGELRARRPWRGRHFWARESSSSGSSARRRRGETRIDLGEDEDGLSSDEATAWWLSTATACGGVASRGAWQTRGVPGGGLGQIPGARRRVWMGGRRVAGQRTGRRPRRSAACRRRHGEKQRGERRDGGDGSFGK